MTFVKGSIDLSPLFRVFDQVQKCIEVFDQMLGFYSSIEECHIVSLYLVARFDIAHLT